MLNILNRTQKASEQPTIPLTSPAADNVVYEQFEIVLVENENDFPSLSDLTETIMFPSSRRQSQFPSAAATSNNHNISAVNVDDGEQFSSLLE